MSHLSPERLAALADEAPTPAEIAHLSACASCAAERAAHAALGALARGQRASIGLPLTRWEALAPALRTEGLIEPAGASDRRTGRARHTRRWLQAAAALVFLAGGTALGRFTAGAPFLPLGNQGPAASRVAAGGDSGTTTFRSVAEARTARTRAQLLYQDATSYLAQNDTTLAGTESPSAMRTRLAALDRVTNAMRAALNDAPYDPVINDYYLTTLGQREAAIRQLDTALPAGMRINSF